MDLERQDWFERSAEWWDSVEGDAVARCPRTLYYAPRSSPGASMLGALEDELGR